MNSGPGLGSFLIAGLGGTYCSWGRGGVLIQAWFVGNESSIGGVHFLTDVQLCNHSSDVKHVGYYGGISSQPLQSIMPLPQPMGHCPPEPLLCETQPHCGDSQQALFPGR